MNWLQALVLGLIQGLTEFLPVSSSGHLAIGRELLGIGAPDDLLFEVTVHAATVLATIVVFRRQLADLLRGLFKFRYNDQTEYVLKICVSMIPVFVVGVFFKDYVEDLFSSLAVVGVALLVTALILFLSDNVHQGRRKNGISYVQAFVIGIAQALAVVPGLSRSGATISTGLLCGAERGNVAQFSFLMVLIPVIGEAFLSLIGGSMSVSSVDALPLAVGFASAFISGLFACRVMISLVRKASLKWFALYCAIVGTVVLISLA